MRRTLVVMVKEPGPGRVKTRLAREIGTVAAAWWYRQHCRRLLRSIDDPRWHLVLAVSPDAEGLTSKVWPDGIVRLAQGRGDIGARMARIFRRFAPDPTVIVGSDIPDLDRVHVARAFAALGRRRAVIGPAHDGGYWLIGLTGPLARRPDLFKNVRWSSRHARADTLANLGGVVPELIDELWDVDEAADISRTAKKNPRRGGEI